MISKAKIKLIHSLETKKYRKSEGLFVAEGHKLVGELLDTGHTPRYLCATSEWQQSNPSIHADDTVTDEELRQASLLKTPQMVLALFPTPRYPTPTPQQLTQQLTLALDGIQDPGNLGTICRIADWFGIGHILCSPDTVDILNPKAVQATMGAISRVKVHYLPLAPYLRECHAAEMPVYGTFLDAPNIYQSQLSTNGIIVMGNEGKGISPDIEALINKRLYIPNYPSDRSTTDSLNVAVATAITCSEFRRRT